MEEEEEDEVECLSPGSEMEWSEPVDETERVLTRELETLRTLILDEGSPPVSPSKWEVEGTIKEAFGIMMRKAMKSGYEDAEALYIGQVKDLEELLEKEQKERKRLEEEERKRPGEEVKFMVRKEMEEALGKYERRQGEERIRSGM